MKIEDEDKYREQKYEETQEEVYRESENMHSMLLSLQKGRVGTLVNQEELDDESCDSHAVNAKEVVKSLALFLYLLFKDTGASIINRLLAFTQRPSYAVDATLIKFDFCGTFTS